MNKWLAVLVVTILLIAGNVYQWSNPKIVEIPSGQEGFDPGAWVQRSAFVNRGSLIDSLKQINSELSKKVKDSQDQIANLTVINGKLNVEADSLEAELETQPIDLDLIYGSNNFQTLYFPKHFGNNLFQVVSKVTVSPDSVKNELELNQLRDIELSVTNTISENQTRMLTYVTSDDFVDLKYQSYTELDVRKRRPWFLYGTATGVIITAIILR